MDLKAFQEIGAVALHHQFGFGDSEAFPDLFDFRVDFLCDFFKVDEFKCKFGAFRVLGEINCTEVSLAQ